MLVPVGLPVTVAPELVSCWAFPEMSLLLGEGMSVEAGVDVRLGLARARPKPNDSNKAEVDEDDRRRFLGVDVLEGGFGELGGREELAGEAASLVRLRILMRRS